MATARRCRPVLRSRSSASFIYIAVADLIPSLHKQIRPLVSVRQIALVLVGIGTIAVFHVAH